MIIGLVIVTLVICGGGTAYFLNFSDDPTLAAATQEKKSVSKKTDCKAAVAVVPAVGLVAGVGILAAGAACE